LARILVKVVREKGSPDSFVGHIGGDDFVFITDENVVDDVCREIIREFDETSPSFYNEQDRSAGYIIGKDRQGKEIKTGLLSVSIGVVTNAVVKITHVAQISETGAELKKYAKSFEKSNFVRDQRKDSSRFGGKQEK
jgi:GGDEF domain-containing protein